MKNVRSGNPKSEVRGPKPGKGDRGIGRDILTIVAVTLAVYANSLSNGLVYDDHFLVETNRQVQEMDLRGVFTTHYWGGYEGNETGQYRPLVILSFALNFALHGLRPFGYHLGNVLIHALNSVLVYLLAFRIGKALNRQGTEDAKRNERSGNGQMVALAAGLLFAVHPIHAEAAAGVTFGRADLLGALFMFGALLFYTPPPSPPLKGEGRKLVRSPFPSGKGVRGLGLSLLCFALALLSKESAVALIGLLALVDVADAEEVQLRRAVTGTLRRRWRVYAVYAVVFAVYLAVRVALGIGFSAGSLSRLNNPLFGTPFSHRLWTAAHLVYLYAGLALFPWRLSVDYSFNAIPVATSAFEPGTLAGMGLALVGVWLLGRAFGRSREAFFAGGFFLITYAPVSQAGALVNALFQERFLYTPLFGVCLLAGLLLRRVEAWRRDAAVAALALATVLCGARTFTRNRDWKDDYTLFASAVEACPQSVKAQSKFGDALVERGQLDGAVDRYREALRMSAPIGADVANVYKNLGNVYHLQGRLNEAVDAYRQAVALQPDDAGALNSLGVVSLKKGDPSEAATCFEKVVALRPDDAEAHYNAGIAHQGAGRLDEAIRHYEKAVALRPDYAEAYFNLGNACRDLGRKAEAIRAYRRFAEVWRGDEQTRGMAQSEIEALEKP